MPCESMGGKMEKENSYSHMKVEAEESEGEFETEEIIEEAEIEESTGDSSKRSKPVIVQMSSNGILLRNTSDTSDTAKDMEDSSQNADGSKQKWSRESTNLLISLRTELDEHFENPKSRKMDYWDYISTIMASAGYQISSHDCHTKWRNLCGTFRMNKEKSHRLGHATIRWEFYDLMDKFMKKKRWVTNTNDPSLKDLDAIEEDDEDEEEDSDDDLEMSRLLRLQSGITEKRPFEGGSSEPVAKRTHSDSPPQWFKDYIKSKEEEEKLRDERFFSILESIKESELRKTALLESLLQYFDRS